MSSHRDPRQLEDLDNLDEETRLECLQHARGCSTCRQVLIVADPTRLFALLALEPVPQAALESLSQGVEAALDRAGDSRAERPRRHMATGAVAASLLLAGVLSTYLWNRQPAESPVHADYITEPRLTEPRQARKLTGTIEVLSPEAAEVLNLQIGDTTVVMIFDEGLEL